MEIKIEGNPGTGNTFQEINIQHADSVNPNATSVTVNHHHYGDSKTAAHKAKGNDADNIDTTPIRTEILNYVSCLRPQLKDEWKNKYMKLWEAILDLDIIESQVYISGKQKNTNFNRNLVANIIHYLDDHQIYRNEYNASTMAIFLEGDKDHSVRAALGKDPSDEIVSRLNRFMETFALK